MDHHIPVEPAATTSLPSVLLAATAALGIAILVAVGSRLGEPPAPSGVAPSAVADEVLRLETIGPRTAWIWHGDFRLGRLDVAPDEHVTGDALVHFPRIVRRFGTRSVAVVKPDDLEPIVAQKVKNMCMGLGALNTRIVTPTDLP